MESESTVLLSAFNSTTFASSLSLEGKSSNNRYTVALKENCHDGAAGAFVCTGAITGREGGWRRTLGRLYSQHWGLLTRPNNEDRVRMSTYNYQNYA